MLTPEYYGNSVCQQVVQVGMYMATARTQGLYYLTAFTAIPLATTVLVFPLYALILGGGGGAHCFPSSQIRLNNELSPTRPIRTQSLLYLNYETKRSRTLQCELPSLCEVWCTGGGAQGPAQGLANRLRHEREGGVEVLRVVAWGRARREGTGRTL